MTTRNGRKFGLRACLAGALLTLPGLALADVNDGVAAWERGDYETAVAEWRGPAGQGDADAQFNLGLAYERGLAVLPDYVLALKWMTAAAERRYALAQHRLAVWHRDKGGVIPLIDYSRCYFWASLAVFDRREGETFAPLWTSDLLRNWCMERISRPSRVLELQEEIREWDAAHPREP